MLESGSWGHSVLQTPALVDIKIVKSFRSEIQDSSHLENLFFFSSSELKGQLTRNLVGSIGVTCRSIMARCDRKSQIAAMAAILKICFELFLLNRKGN